MKRSRLVRKTPLQRKTPLKSNTPLERKTPLNRGGYLKRESEKAKARRLEAQPFRKEIKDQIGKCECCGKPRDKKRFHIEELDRLEVHEIANGIHRQKALDKPYAVLVVCGYCNKEEMTNKGKHPVSRQLYMLHASRPNDFDLDSFNALVGNGPFKTEITEVMKWQNKTNQ